MAVIYNRTMNLCWAIPVDWAHLGARLEAYGEMQQAMTALRLCSKNSTIPALNALLADIMLLIEIELQDSTYHDFSEGKAGCKQGCAHSGAVKNINIAKKQSRTKIEMPIHQLAGLCMAIVNSAIFAMSMSDSFLA